MPTQLITRGATWNIYEELVVEHCCNCGMPFAMPRAVYDELRRHSSGSDLETKSFYCPAGHQQHYTGKNEEQRLREQLERTRQDREWQREQRLAAERSNVALKGVVTRTKRRVGNGVCPCCNRTFSQLQRHMESQHPDFALDDEPPVSWEWPASSSTIRAWALTAGFHVARRGALPKGVREAYRQAATSRLP